MNQASRRKLFRQSAEAEDGVPVSAGARVAHVRSAVESGRAFYVDLSGVPVDQRPALIAQIEEMVKRHSKPASQADRVPTARANRASK